MKMGGKIKQLRKQQNWSQAELAEKLGVHLTHVSRLETGRYAPSLELLKKLASLFEVTTDYLLYEEAEQPDMIRLEDKNFLKKIRLVEDLQEEERHIILGVINSFLTQHQLRKVLSKEIAA